MVRLVLQISYTSDNHTHLHFSYESLIQSSKITLLLQEKVHDITEHIKGLTDIPKKYCSLELDNVDERVNSRKVSELAESFRKLNINNHYSAFIFSFVCTNSNRFTR